MDQENTGSQENAGGGEPSTKVTEVSAATIGRMMGLVTAAEFKLLEGKVDLLVTKLTGAVMKVEKVLQILGGAPTGADLERIDVQIGSLKTLIKEVLGDKSEDEGKTPRGQAIGSANE